MASLKIALSVLKVRLTVAGLSFLRCLAIQLFTSLVVILSKAFPSKVGFKYFSSNLSGTHGVGYGQGRFSDSNSSGRGILRKSLRIARVGAIADYAHYLELAPTDEDAPKARAKLAELRSGQGAPPGSTPSRSP